MSQQQAPLTDSPAAVPPAPTAVPLADSAGLGRLADHWGLVLAYGVVTIGVALTLAVWPGETLKVLAILVGIQFLVSGVLRILTAVGGGGLDGGIRALLGISGALALIVGLLCLRAPLQTAVAIGIILGVWWLVSGVVDIIGALLSPVPGRRALDIATGVISVGAGGLLLAYPDATLGLFVVVACTWLFAIGFIAVVSAFTLRAKHHRHPDDAPVAVPAA